MEKKKIINIRQHETTTLKYDEEYEADSNNFHFEFDLESLDFITSEDGELCEVYGEIQITYQDGSTVRRELRRGLLEGKNEQTSSSFTITKKLVAVGTPMIGQVEITQFPMKNNFALLFFGFLGVMIGYGHRFTKEKRAQQQFDYLLQEESEL